MHRRVPLVWQARPGLTGVAGRTAIWHLRKARLQPEKAALCLCRCQLLVAPDKNIADCVCAVPYCSTTSAAFASALTTSFTSATFAASLAAAFVLAIAASHLGILHAGPILSSILHAHLLP
eukprot:CAMPEP_0115134310 /NCGR_PEP_ID=MMETSP0227-20121206/55016_1 /TAXON_ID=89957 /ORGANISM="Polarella glacialis, Strain CCMP 1383" /LENGTH=120 /DNA_ID=CAMNT_0002540757 /DNA_START=389 /DNA_END=748 /DNA_ORIENTATION=-